jgi:hypothetical protein
MVRHIWSVVCQSSTIDQDDNSLSINNVLDTINIRLDEGKQKSTKFVIPLNFEVVSLLSNVKSEQETRVEIKVVILNPNMDKLGDFTTPIIIPSGKKRMRSRIKMSGLPIKGQGDYVVLVSIKTEEDKEFKNVADLPFEVKFEKE